MGQEAPEAAAASSSSSSSSSKPKKQKVAKSSPLFDIQWFRVVLDEAHAIRDRSTQQAKAAFQLSTLCERRWCLSGTPMQNRLEDLYSLLVFLRLEPFSSSHDWWTRIIARPLRHQDQAALSRLQTLIGYVCLRRRKSDQVDGKPLVALPEKRSFYKHVTMLPAEQHLYDHLSTSGRQRFEELIAQGKVMANYAFVLEMLLRMRQACCHGSLVPKRLQSEGFESISASDLTELKKLVARLESALAEEDFECCLCLTAVQTPVVTRCCHVFCRECLLRALSSKPQCPLCRGEVTPSSLVEPKMKETIEAEEKRIAEGAPEGFRASSKLLAVLETINEAEAKRPGSKVVVFSQWTGLLDLCSRMLDEHKISTTRLDGAMTNARRQQSLERFQSDPTVRVMLISLKAGGVGINLTAANTAVFLDPWWNSAQEEQAEERIYRIGQTQPVEIYRIIVKGTVEDKVLEIQERKKKLIQSAFDPSKVSSEQRLQDLVSLFTT